MNTQNHLNVTFAIMNFPIRHFSIVRDGKKPFKCDICDYSCSENADMKRHFASVHKGKKLFTNDICDHIYSRKY